MSQSHFGSGVEQAQQEVVRLAVARLHESRCLWRRCDAILNSTESLTRHVHVHAEEDVDAVCLVLSLRLRARNLNDAR